MYIGRLTRELPSECATVNATEVTTVRMRDTACFAHSAYTHSGTQHTVPAYTRSLLTDRISTELGLVSLGDGEANCTLSACDCRGDCLESVLLVDLVGQRRCVSGFQRVSGPSQACKRARARGLSLAASGMQCTARLHGPLSQQHGDAESRAGQVDGVHCRARNSVGRFDQLSALRRTPLL